MANYIDNAKREFEQTPLRSIAATCAITLFVITAMGWLYPHLSQTAKLALMVLPSAYAFVVMRLVTKLVTAVAEKSDDPLTIQPRDVIILLCAPVIAVYCGCRAVWLWMAITKQSVESTVPWPVYVEVLCLLVVSVVVLTCVMGLVLLAFAIAAGMFRPFQMMAKSMKILVESSASNTQSNARAHRDDLSSSSPGQTPDPAGGTKT
jgi:hypothetical protein